MRVAHITPVFPPYRGGMGTVAFQQAQALAELGVEVTVLTPRRARPSAGSASVEVLELAPLLARGNAACLPQVLTAVRGFDVVHLHYPFFGTAELVAARCAVAGPPLVLQYQMDVVAMSWKARLFHWHRQLVLPYLLRAAGAVVVLSSDYAATSFLAEHLDWLQPRLHVIPAAVDLGVFSPARASADAELRQRSGGAPTVLFVAQLDRAHYFKGLHVLIEALRMIPEAHLVVGGDGEWREHYAQQAAERLGPRAHFLGDVPDELLPSLYRTADVVALPSTDRTEAFGLVLVEAMACGTPVVASRLPGVRTLVDEGCNGFLVEPGNPIDLADKLARCLRDSGEMGRRARDLVAARYGAEQSGQRLLDLYETLAPTAPRIAPQRPTRHRSVAGFL